MPTAAVADVPPHARIAKGMTITQVQALMGLPSAVKSLRDKEVMFFCPESLFGFQVGDPIYTRVYLDGRRVVSSQTQLAPAMGSCEECISAFQWSDPLPPPSYVPQK